MKVLKALMLGMVFLFGLTAMSSDKESLEATSDKAVFEKQTDCSDDFNRCNVAYPESYKKFDSCMRQNGCG